MNPWTIISICIGGSGVLLIPALVGMVKVWNRGVETERRVTEGFARVDKSIEKLQDKVDGHGQSLARIEGMLSGRDGKHE